VARNAKNPAFSIAGGTRNYLDQRHTRRGARACDFTSREFTVSALFDPLVCYSQLLPPSPTGPALRGSPHSAAADRQEVLLSPGNLPTEDHDASGFQTSLKSHLDSRSGGALECKRLVLRRAEKEENALQASLGCAFQRPHCSGLSIWPPFLR
jgi:hypothetical protein